MSRRSPARRWLLAASLCAGGLACGHAGPQRVDTTPEPADVRDAAAEAALGPDAIQVVQRALADRGFDVQPTGILDEPTRSALQGFQRTRGLAATGGLDAPTVEALGIDPADLQPRRSPGKPAAPARKAPPKKSAG